MRTVLLLRRKKIVKVKKMILIAIALMVPTVVFSDIYDAPLQDICYEIYEEKNSLSCKGPQRKDRIACLTYINDKNNYGLITPTNETILFVPPFYGFSRCFDIYKRDILTNVCKENDHYSQSLTTPDNYTIWLRALNCRSYEITRGELEEDEVFVTSFKFDREEKSCYKVYGPNGLVSPYTCAETNDTELCVQEIGDCSVLTTPQNETVNLGCSNGTGLENNCVDVSYNSTEKKVCLEKLEERCVGFTMPSGLRVLVACKDCFRDSILEFSYNSSLWKQHRAYIKQYLSEEQQGNHRHIHKQLDIFENNDLSQYPEKKYSCFDARSNCYVVTLESNETVYVYCPNGTNDHPGCYKVVDEADKTESSACVRVIDDKCVGIVTSKNTLIMFECFNEYSGQKQKDSYLDMKFREYKDGKHLYPADIFLYMYKISYENNTCNELYESYENNSRITTPDDEILVIEDTNANMTHKYGEFFVYDSSNTRNTVTTIELERIDNECIGVKTPKGWNVVFVCYSSSTGIARGDGGVLSIKSFEPTLMI